MPIPDLQPNGLLPSGVYDCTLEEVAASFAWNPHRRNLFDLFNDFFSNALRPRFHEPIFFDGSFVTDKDHPDDTDIVLDLTVATDERAWQGLCFMRDHQRRIMNDFRVHFWVNLPGNNDFAAYFQYVGVKTAKMKGLMPKDLKGILRVI
jgi:hypothetical protein